MGTNAKHFHEKLQRLKCQFLCAFPLNNIEWQELTEHNSWEEQKLILNATNLHPINQKQPIKISYQVNFLKRLINTLEQRCTEEVHDDLYGTLCQLHQQLAAEEQQKFVYKHYLLPGYQTHFTLRESKSFVAEGTTGLCSWQASLALADYLLHHADIVEGKSVLELGAGTGLCGFIITRCCGASRVCLTDGSQECIELMHENIRSNFPKAIEDRNGCYALPTQLSCFQLGWDCIAEAKLTEFSEPDVVLAADVVYDTAVLPDLSKTINYIFKTMENKTRMLLAATVRNEETLGAFLNLLLQFNFTVAEKEVIPLQKSHLFWDRSTPVKIFLITRIAA